MIARRLTVINILFLVVCAALAAGVLPGWFSPPPVEQVVAGPGGTDAETTAALPPREGISYPSFADFASVADRNLFHPDRKYVKPAPAAGPPPERPAFALYGVIEAGPQSVAMLEDRKTPVTTKGRGRRLVSLRIGETLSGYRLESVAPDSVVMAYGDERIVLPLVDPDNPKHRVTQTAPTAKAAAATAPRRPQRKSNLADAFRVPRDKARQRRQ